MADVGVLQSWPGLSLLASVVVHASAVAPEVGREPNRGVRLPSATQGRTGSSTLRLLAVAATATSPGKDTFPNQR